MANTLLDAKKEKEITHVVELLKQIELPDILLIGRDVLGTTGRDGRGIQKSFYKIFH